MPPTSRTLYARVSARNPSYAQAAPYLRLNASQALTGRFPGHFRREGDPANYNGVIIHRRRCCQDSVIHRQSRMVGDVLEVDLGVGDDDLVSEIDLPQLVETTIELLVMHCSLALARP